jgi:hypothetical protein
MDWKCGSRGRAPALQAQTPEFKPQSPGVGVAQAEESLPCKCEVLSSNPSIKKKKKKPHQNIKINLKKKKQNKIGWRRHGSSCRAPA